MLFQFPLGKRRALTGCRPCRPRLPCRRLLFRADNADKADNGLRLASCPGEIGKHPPHSSICTDRSSRYLGVVQIGQPPAIDLYTLRSVATTKMHDRHFALPICTVRNRVKLSLEETPKSSCELPVAERSARNLAWRCDLPQLCLILTGATYTHASLRQSRRRVGGGVGSRIRRFSSRIVGPMRRAG